MVIIFYFCCHQIYCFINCRIVSSFKPCISSGLNWYNNTFHIFTTIGEYSHEFFLCFSGSFLLERVFFLSLLITCLSSSLPPPVTCPSPCPLHPHYFRMCLLFMSFWLLLIFVFLVLFVFVYFFYTDENCLANFILFSLKNVHLKFGIQLCNTSYLQPKIFAAVE